MREDPEELQLVLVQRHRMVRRQARAAARGVLFSLAVIGLALSGLLPMAASTQSLLLLLAGTLAITRLLRGLWAARVARHLAQGWVARHRLAPERPVSANRRAVLSLTELPDEPLVAQARRLGLAHVSRMEELQGILADPGLAAPLRRPVAEELARVEAELESLLAALVELTGADRRQRQDLLGQLSARLELEGPVPDGLYTPT